MILCDVTQHELVSEIKHACGNSLVMRDTRTQTLPAGHPACGNAGDPKPTEPQQPQGILWRGPSCPEGQRPGPPSHQSQRTSERDRRAPIAPEHLPPTVQPPKTPKGISTGAKQHPSGKAQAKHRNDQQGKGLQGQGVVVPRGTSPASPMHRARRDCGRGETSMPQEQHSSRGERGEPQHTNQCQTPNDP